MLTVCSFWGIFYDSFFVPLKICAQRDALSHFVCALWHYCVCAFSNIIVCTLWHYLCVHFGLIVCAISDIFFFSMLTPPTFICMSFFFRVGKKLLFLFFFHFFSTRERKCDILHFFTDENMGYFIWIRPTLALFGNLRFFLLPS